jgi:2-methylfumaryl-CoA isomerase
LACWFARRTVSEASRELATTSVLWSRYRTFKETAEAIRSGSEGDLFGSLEQPGVGTYLAPKLPDRFASFENCIAPAPILGGDTSYILKSVGEANSAIAELFESRIVGESETWTI